MRHPILLAVMLLAGCATASAPTTRTPITTQVETAAGTYDLGMIAETRAATDWVNAPVDEVWTRLLEGYRSLGIELRTVDSDQRIAGNQHARVRGRLAGDRLSSYFRCGKNPIGAPLADESSIELNVLTQLKGVSGGTTVTTVVQAQARPRSGRTNWIRCSSTGKLEARIAELVGVKAEA